MLLVWLVLQASEVPNLLEQLQECNVQLDVVEKGLNDLLDTKKMAFPRYSPALNNAALVYMLDAMLLTHDPAACLVICSVRFLEMFVLSMSMTQLHYSFTALR